MVVLQRMGLNTYHLTVLRRVDVSSRPFYAHSKSLFNVLLIAQSELLRYMRCLTCACDDGLMHGVITINGSNESAVSFQGYVQVQAMCKTLVHLANWKAQSWTSIMGRYKAWRGAAAEYGRSCVWYVRSVIHLFLNLRRSGVVIKYLLATSAKCAD
jgi:hypothetical protein